MNQEERVEIKIVGSINEEVNFPVVGTPKYLIVNLEEVKTINSSGIREWLKWIKHFPQDLEIEYHNCPSFIVDQFNLIKGFLGHPRFVKSIYVPYYCEKCDDSFRNKIDLNNSFHPVELKEELPCPKCKSLSEIDVIQEKFLGFLKKDGN